MAAFYHCATCGHDLHKWSDEKLDWVCAQCGEIVEQVEDDSPDYEDRICEHCHGTGVHWDGPGCAYCDDMGYKWWL